MHFSHREQQARRTPAAGTHAAIFPRRPDPATQSLDASIIRKADAIRASPAKRGMDVLLGSCLLVLLAPLFATIAVAIKLDSDGPVFFRQKRYGANRHVFRIWKFRTMRVMETEGDFLQAAQHDSRVTRVGAVLRKTSLDEIPQLINVVTGSMSLVGPRPHALVMDDHFARLIPKLPARHLVRPGLTGLAQVSGFRGPTDDHDAMAGRVDKDVAYIADWSIGRDVHILLSTPVALLRTTSF